MHIPCRWSEVLEGAICHANASAPQILYVQNQIIYTVFCTQAFFWHCRSLPARNNLTIRFFGAAGLWWVDCHSFLRDRHVCIAWLEYYIYISSMSQSLVKDVMVPLPLLMAMPMYAPYYIWFSGIFLCILPRTALSGYSGSIYIAWLFNTFFSFRMRFLPGSL